MQKHREQILLIYRRQIIKLMSYIQSIYLFLVLSFLVPAMLSSPGAGLQNAINTVGPGQSNATAINSPATNFDPSSMQRAYAALGLPYGNQSPAQVQGQGSAQQNPQHQQLRSMNPLGME